MHGPGGDLQAVDGHYGDMEAADGHRCQFPPSPTAPRRARRWAVEVLGLRGPAADDVAILVSEAVSNSVLHAGLDEDHPISVQVARAGQDDGIRIEVCDEGGRFGGPSASAGREDGGHGLRIIRRMCADWGVEANGVTRFWCVYDPRRAAPAGLL